MLNRCSVGCAPRRRQPREGEWEPRKRTAADCEGGPEVQRLSQLAREKKKKKKNVPRPKICAGAFARMGPCSRSREVMVPFMVSESAVALNEE